ncbi:FAD-dependent monooxygenase [Rickettsiales bacterium]|nr:FAD-dependent monooxygenase [Rickettsiales bacterium]
MDKHFDITIIGGSFAGMTAALYLANISKDFKIAIIEKNYSLKSDKEPDGRGFAISSRSLEIFKEIGIYDELQDNAGIIKDIKITDCDSVFILDFLGINVDKDNKQLGQIIESYKIHNSLRKKIAQCENITTYCPNIYQEVCHDKSMVTLNNRMNIYSKLILACDGKFSDLRQKFNINTIEKNYKQTAIVFNIKHKKPHNNCAWEKFYPGGPLAVLPLNSQNQSTIVWIVKNSHLKAYLGLSNKDFSNQLSQKISHELGEIESISKKFTYSLRLIESEIFYSKKLILAGDSSCAIHPIAGQGFNLAISSIKILRDLIKKNYLNAIAIDSQNLIEEYNRKARFNAVKIAAATDILNSIFDTKSIAIGAIRKFGLLAINKIPKLKKFFIKSAGGY